jgi:hypothetical protein
MGMDMYRREAARAVNAYAGRVVITIQDEQALVNAETSAGTLAKVRSIISSIK